MRKMSHSICKHKWLIIIITIIMMIPALIGYIFTDINYDILVYLPSDIETLKGEKILTDDFNMGSFSIVVADEMSSKEILELEDKFRGIDAVGKVVSLRDVIGTTIPREMLPQEIVSKVSGKGELILVTFENSTSDEKTLEAVEQMRNMVDGRVKIGGMSAMVLDTKDLFNSEMLFYVIIAAVLCIVVLELSLDSYLVPLLLMANIGIAILFNMGSNIIFGEISYITKAIAAVLQLGVTTDFSIFLYHKYESSKSIYSDKEQAMEHAICDTLVSVFGSSLTTIAGFLALCTMNLTLGVDIGLVMAKGVFIGVVCVITVFPALLLVFDKQIERTKHRGLLPKFERVKSFVLKHYVLIFIVFLVLLIPSYLAQSKTQVYYKLDESIPEDYGYSMATQALKEEYGMVSQEIILVSNDLEDYKIMEMENKIKSLEGVDLVINPARLSEYGITDNIVPEEVRSIYETDNYKLMIVASKYDIATTELNEQLEKVEKIVKSYDKNSILAGEGALMKDLVVTTDEDFHNVNYTSIGIIFILMMIVLKSISLPVLLVTAIEFAIFINMGIPYFTGTEIPFIASVVIGTIQLGATIDYAILMTTKYLEERKNGQDKRAAVRLALDSSISSIFVSALCFFGATIGVGCVSKIDMIGSLCTLIARGAVISMIVVVMVIPAILIIMDSIIMKTTLGMKNKSKKGSKTMKRKKMMKAISMILIVSIILSPIGTWALTKEEAVYVKLNNNGEVNKVLVNEHLINHDKLNEIEDYTDLEDILNINSNHTFTRNNQLLIWNSKGNDIFYQGTSKKEIPVTESISYTLDGKGIELENLIGKSGKVTIDIAYQNKDRHVVSINGKNENLYTPFVVMMGTIIPGKNNSNISITNGKVINNGSNYIIVGLSTPGLYESLNFPELEGLNNVKITFDTEKFELPSIYSVVTPKILESSDLDVFNKLDSLYGDVSKLESSMNQIQKGSQTILENLTVVSSGSSQISENLNIVFQKLEEIKTGAVSIDTGLKQILEQLSILQKNLNNLENEEKLNQVKGLIQQNNATILNIKTSNSELQSAYNNYQLASISYEDLLASNLENRISLYQIKYNYENSYSVNEQLMKLLEANNLALQSSLNSISQVSTEVNNLIKTLNIYLGQLEQGASELSNGTATLKEAIGLINSKMSELSNGTAVLKDGMATLNTGIEIFNRDGVGTITAMAKSSKAMKDRVQALVELGSNYQSFSLNNKNVEGSTKFIMMVEGVEAPKQTTKKVKEVKKEGFLERLINLFD